MSKPPEHDPAPAARSTCTRDRPGKDQTARAEWLELIKVLARECAKRDHDAESP